MFILKKTQLSFLALFLTCVLSMASVFITHGGGPMPLYLKQQHTQLYHQFQQIQKEFPNPKAIIIFSAHWEETEWTMIDYDNPPHYYDYYGFPAETYNLTYPIGSNSEVRNRVKEEFNKQGVKLKLDYKRGYDHGVFIPLMIMYPKANVPVIQISILKSLNPEAHYRLGVALRDLKNQGYLILGSGASIHGGFGRQQSINMSKVFDSELTDLAINYKSEEELLDRLKNWKKMKYANNMHPRQEHLIPLFINLGACEGKNRKNRKVFLMGVHLSNYILN